MKTVIVYFLTLFSLVARAQDGTFSSLSDKANTLIEEQKYEEALACFEKAFETGCDDKDLLSWTAVMAGICAQQTDDLEKAYKFFGIAVNNGCKEPDIYERYIRIAEEGLKDPQKIEEALLVAKKQMDTGSNKYVVKLMYHYYNSRQYEKTIGIVDTLLYKGDRQVQFYNIKGMSLQQMMKTEEAIPVYKEILKINPNDFNALRQLGLIYYEKAIDLYNNSMKSYKSIANPTTAEYDAILDMTRKVASYNQEAVSYLEQAEMIQPGDPAVLEFLAKGRKKTGK